MKWYSIFMTIAEPEVIQKPKMNIKISFGWKVVVLNDDHNTFDHVANTLSRFIPDIDLEKGYEIALVVHNTGSAVVYSGLKKDCETYWLKLKSANLSLAPLERD